MPKVTESGNFQASGDTHAASTVTEDTASDNFSQDNERQRWEIFDGGGENLNSSMKPRPPAAHSPGRDAAFMVGEAGIFTTTRVPPFLGQSTVMLPW